MLYTLIGKNGGGFTNQIFALVTSILIAHYKNKKIVMADRFLNDISDENYTNISEILDLPKLNEYLKTYDVIVADKHVSTIQNFQLFYGTPYKKIDITDKMMSLYSTGTGIHIPKGVVLNEIVGDPCYGVEKKLFVNYAVNQHKIHETFGEQITEAIRIDTEAEYKNTFAWINAYDKTLFDHILTNLDFHKDLVEKAQTMMDISYSKVNVIHLRLEKDIVHWANINHMTEKDFRRVLERKYIDQIKENLSKTELTIVLSQSVDNPVLDYLKENHYPYQVNTKFFHEREKDAIIDLLISSRCNHIFIGNFNIHKLNGSSFSYFIGKRLPTVRKINIDLDRIMDPVYECI